MSTFQKCPLCEGTGVDPNVLVSNISSPPCPVCNGKRIISTLTGLPPKIGQTGGEWERHVSDLKQRFQEKYNETDQTTEAEKRTEA